MKPQGVLWAAAFSRDGKTVLTVAYLGLQVWDAATGRLIGSTVKQSQNSPVRGLQLRTAKGF